MLPEGVALTFIREIDLGRVVPGSEVRVERGVRYLFILEDGSFYLQHVRDYDDSRLRTGRLSMTELDGLLTMLATSGDPENLSGEFTNFSVPHVGLEKFQMKGMSAPLLCTALCEGTVGEPVLAELMDLMDTQLVEHSQVVSNPEFRIVAQPLEPADRPWELGNAVAPFESPFELGPAIRPPGPLPPFTSSALNREQSAALEGLLLLHGEQVASSSRYVTNRILYLFERDDPSLVFQVFFRDQLPDAEADDGELHLDRLPSVPNG